MTLDQLIDYYAAAYGSQYLGYIKAIDKKNGGKTAGWIDSVIRKKGTVQDVLELFDQFFMNNSSLSAKTISNYRSGFIKFSEVIIGLFSANTWMTRSQRRSTRYLCQLVADNAIFASKEVVEMIRNGKLGTDDNINKKGNEYASWDYMLHIRDTKHKKGSVIPGDKSLYQILCIDYPQVSRDVIADDNTLANRAIKTAVLKSFELKFGSSKYSYTYFRGYEACHIWDLTDDRRYYASIANLVLIPRALAALTDHFQEVKDLLRVETYKRFGFIPDGMPLPASKNHSQVVWRYSF